MSTLNIEIEKNVFFKKNIEMKFIIYVERLNVISGEVYDLKKLFLTK